MDGGGSGVLIGEVARVRLALRRAVSARLAACCACQAARLFLGFGLVLQVCGEW